MSRGWNPWSALRERDHLTLRWARLRGCREVIIDRQEGRTIYLDARLERRARNALLAHALVHDERHLYRPTDPFALIVREEEQVRRITVDRLVPPAQLRVEVVRLVELGEPVRAIDVMELFDVPVDVAHKALCLMQIRSPGRL